jgi:hypothetical protein
MVLERAPTAYGSDSSDGPTLRQRDARRKKLFELLQIRVFCLGLLQDGNVGVVVFPEGQEIFVGGERPNASGISIRPLRCS